MRISSLRLFAAAFASAMLAGGAARAAAPEDSKIFTPYFNMSLAEGWYLPSSGDAFSGGTMDTQIGLLSNVADHNSIYSLYSFRYQGPSFQPQDSTQFQARQINHLFSLEYRWQSPSETWRLRPGLSYMKNFSRTGGSEDWSTGLYNMNSAGGQLAADYMFEFRGREGSLTTQYLYRKVQFPNYTDLLSEFEGATADNELSGGLYDQSVNQISARLNWNRLSGGLSYSRMSYLHQTVIGDDGQYGTSKQRDNNVTLDVSGAYRWWLIDFYPTASASFYRSNQNYLRYKYFGAVASLGDLNDPSGDVTYIPNNYSYNQYDINVPMDFNFSAISQWAFSGGVWLTRRSYTDRPPRDANNNYLSGTQANTLTRFYFGLRKHMNEIADFRITYMYTIASSNNKYEVYMPYNYTGSSINFAYSLTF